MVLNATKAKQLMPKKDFKQKVKIIDSLIAKEAKRNKFSLFIHKSKTELSPEVRIHYRTQGFKVSNKYKDDDENGPLLGYTISWL